MSHQILNARFTRFIIGAVALLSTTLAGCDSAPETSPPATATATEAPTQASATLAETPTAAKPAAANQLKLAPVTEDAPALDEVAVLSSPMKATRRDALPVDEAARSKRVPKEARERTPRKRKVRGKRPLSIVDAAVTVGVTDRMPEGRKDDFGDDIGRVWAWIRVRNPGDAADIEMVWRHEGREMARVSLEVGHSWGWRTWSNKRISPDQTGEWTVEVVDGDGETLEEMRFLVSPAQS